MESLVPLRWAPILGESGVRLGHWRSGDAFVVGGKRSPGSWEVRGRWGHRRSGITWVMGGHGRSGDAVVKGGQGTPGCYFLLFLKSLSLPLRNPPPHSRGASSLVDTSWVFRRLRSPGALHFRSRHCGLVNPGLGCLRLAYTVFICVYVGSYEESSPPATAHGGLTV